MKARAVKTRTITVEGHILEQAHVKSFEALKKRLKRKAKCQWDTLYAEIKGNGFRIVYTNNPNCWASYIVSFPGIGMTMQYALDRDSITPEGRKRGCGDMYLKELHLTTKLQIPA